MLDPVNLLKQLVAIPSVNPMGREVDGPEFLENRVTDYLESIFRNLNLPWERATVAPQRDNILIRLDGELPVEAGGPLIVFEAHQDTVPVDGMIIDPWDPVVRDGKLYGRGSCDVKGGLAAMLAALSRLAAEPPQGRPTIVLACTVNEEYGFSGAKALVEQWSNSQSSILPRKPDAVIVAEPTKLNIVVAHKGTIRWRCQTHGQASHSSQPDLGINAIYRMARVLEALEKYQQEVTPSLGHHPLCGSPTLSVGTIRGGISVNTVPDECTIELDRRVMPGEDAETAYQHVLSYLEQQNLGFDVTHERPFLKSSGLLDTANRELAESLSERVTQRAGGVKQIGVPFGTNASVYAAAGAPAIVFGPGDIAQAHTADEWIEIEQLRVATDILYDFGKRGIR